MGYIYLITGNGASKTTSALGVALRAIGHAKKVLIIQFLKWDHNTGEYQAQYIEGIKKYLTVIQYGRKEWHDGLSKLGEEDREQSLEALKDAKFFIEEYGTNILILDEINLAYQYKLLTFEEIKGFLDSLPVNVSVMLTGRGADDKLITICDAANSVVELKSPKGFFINEEGVNY